MPQIIIRGMSQEDVKSISKQLVTELTECIGCPREYFTIELLQTICISEGEVSKSTLFVQVNWFDRGQAVRDQAAAILDRNIRNVGYSEIEIYFLVLDENKYYENGCHY